MIFIVRTLLVFEGEKKGISELLPCYAFIHYIWRTAYIVALSRHEFYINIVWEFIQTSLFCHWVRKSFTIIEICAGIFFRILFVALLLVLKLIEQNQISYFNIRKEKKSAIKIRPWLWIMNICWTLYFLSQRQSAYRNFSIILFLHFISSCKISHGSDDSAWKSFA